MSEEVSGALPSLISLMVSVDVKPHVLLLLRWSDGLCGSPLSSLGTSPVVSHGAFGKATM